MARRNWFPITMRKRKELARRVVRKAGLKSSPALLGKARRIIEELVEAEPNQYLTFYEKYCSPKEDAIIDEVVKRIHTKASDVKRGQEKLF